MNSIDELRQRVEAAESRFGLIHERQRQYSERVLAVLSGIEDGLAERQTRIEALEAELAAARAENGELRALLDNLLHTIEEDRGTAGDGDELHQLESRASALAGPAAAAGLAAGLAMRNRAAPAIDDEAQAETAAIAFDGALDHDAEPEAERADEAAAITEPEEIAALDEAAAIEAEPMAADADDDLDLDAAWDEEPMAEDGTDAEPEASIFIEADSDIEIEEAAPARAEPLPQAGDMTVDDIAKLIGRVSAAELGAAPARAGEPEPIDADFEEAIELVDEVADDADTAGAPLPPADVELTPEDIARLLQTDDAAPAVDAGPAREVDLDIDLDGLLADLGAIAKPDAAADRPNDAHAPDFDPEIDEILSHVRKGIQLPEGGKK